MHACALENVDVPHALHAASATVLSLLWLKQFVDIYFASHLIKFLRKTKLIFKFFKENEADFEPFF